MRNISITGLRRIHAAGGVDARRDLKAHLPRRWSRAVCESGDIEQRAQARIAHRAQAVEPVLDNDAILAGERNHVGHRGDGHDFQ